MYHHQLDGSSVRDLVILLKVVRENCAVQGVEVSMNTGNVDMEFFQNAATVEVIILQVTGVVR